MRTLNRNKQKMYYSLPDGRQPKYKRDSSGQIIYTEVDGVQVPIATGEYEPAFTTPVEFYGNIAAKLHEVIIQSYGTDDSTNYASLVVNKGELPLTVGSLIWRTTEIEYDSDGTVKKDTADYVVRGVLNEALDEDAYFLRKLNSGAL